MVSCNDRVDTRAANHTIEQDTTLLTTPQVDSSLQWLVGNWKRLNEETGKETFECWAKLDSAHFTGVGFTICNGDTISKELMDLVDSSGIWSFEVKLAQEQEPTIFKVISIKPNEFVCVNDSNEFPKNIQYRMDEQRLKAKIFNTDREVTFDFEKLN